MTNKITSMLLRLAAQFLKPTLALLAALAVGGAWADVKYVTVQEACDDFEDSNSYTANVETGKYTLPGSSAITTGGVSPTLSQGERDLVEGGTSHFLNVTRNGQNNPNALIYNFHEKVKSATDYILEFDVFMSSPYANNSPGSSYLQVVGSNGVLFYIELTYAWNSNLQTGRKIYKGDGTEIGEISVAGRESAAATSAYWRHFVIKGNETVGIKLSILDRDKTTSVLKVGDASVSEVSISDSFDTPSFISGLFYRASSYSLNHGIDDVILKVPAREGQKLVWSADNADNTDWTAAGAWTEGGVSGKTFANGDDVTISASSFGESEAAKTIAVSTTVAPLSFTADIPADHVATITGEGSIENLDAAFVKRGQGTLSLNNTGNKFASVMVENGVLNLTANALPNASIINYEEGLVQINGNVELADLSAWNSTGGALAYGTNANYAAIADGSILMLTGNSSVLHSLDIGGTLIVSGSGGAKNMSSNYKGSGNIVVTNGAYLVFNRNRNLNDIGITYNKGFSGDLYIHNNSTVELNMRNTGSGAFWGSGTLHMHGGSLILPRNTNRDTRINDVYIADDTLNYIQIAQVGYNFRIDGAMTGAGTLSIDPPVNNYEQGIQFYGNNSQFSGIVSLNIADAKGSAIKNSLSGSSSATWNINGAPNSLGTVMNFDITSGETLNFGALNIASENAAVWCNNPLTMSIGNKGNSTINGKFALQNSGVYNITKVGTSTLTIGSGFGMADPQTLGLTEDDYTANTYTRTLTINQGKVVADMDITSVAVVSLTAVGTSIDVLKTVTLSDASKITQTLGDGYDVQFSEGETYNTYTLVEVSSVAEVDGQPYATLQAAADAAAEGATITMTGSTTDGVSLKRGQVLVVGDNSCGTVSGATQYISVSYNETTKSWTAVETATWNGGAGNWNLASNWNTSVVPSRYTEVAISNAGDDYINVYLTAGAECKAMNISGKVYFSQENAATDVHNAIAMYGNITGTGTIKLIHTGFANSSEAAITIAPDVVIADPGADSDSWISGGNITMSGSVTVERKFVIWGTNNTFSGSLIFSSNAHLGCWGDGAKGLVFNNVSITSGEDANIWLGTDKSQSSISGTGCTLSGSLRINTDNGTTISAPVTLNNNASLVVTDGGTISSVAAANATYLVADSTSGGLKTYTANVAPLVVNNVGYPTLANAWNAAGNDNNAAWIYVYASLPQEDTVTMTAGWQKLRVVPGEYSIDGHVLLASTLENVTLKKDVGTEMTEYTAYPTVKVTVTPGAGVASGEIAAGYISKDGAVYTIYSGSEVTITWTAAEGYEFAGGESTATTVISPTGNVTPECPAATEVVVGSVSIAAPVVGAYGNDFATVSVTAGVTSTYPAATTITYTLKANGTAIATTTAAGDATSVTFGNANVSGLTRYGNISYTVEASGTSVTTASSAATTAMLADAKGWIDEKKSTTGTTGSWKTADGAAATVTYDDETERAELSDNKFSATNCSTGDVVTVTIKDVIYTALSDTSTVDADAQGSIALGGTESERKFMVLTKSGNEVQWSEAAGVNPALNTSYTIVFTFDYNSNKYSITVNGAALTVGGSATYDIVKTTNKYVKDIDFLGAGSIKAIEGIQYDAMMAVDQNGVRYATVAAALDANKAVKGAIIKLLHGTANTNIAGWNYNADTKTFIKKAVGLIFLAF